MTVVISLCDGNYGKKITGTATIPIRDTPAILHRPHAPPFSFMSAESVDKTYLLLPPELKIQEPPSSQSNHLIAEDHIVTCVLQRCNRLMLPSAFLQMELWTLASHH